MARGREAYYNTPAFVLFKNDIDNAVKLFM